MAARIRDDLGESRVANFADNFGANEWLVDEMFEKYKEDPNSVDKTWWDFFKDYSPQTPTGKPLSNGANGSSGLGTLASAPKGGNPPTPKKERSSESPLSKPVPVAPTPVTPTPVAQTPVTPTAVAPTPVSSPLPKVSPSVNPSAPRISPSATPADPVVRPIPTLVTPGASTTEPIRGVAARVVQSMEASLTVPTATSVRAIPAKLMIDNRTVIN
jgi:multifunctional 2-oxoglutarate metabolism enzyme